MKVSAKYFSCSKSYGLFNWRVFANQVTYNLVIVIYLASYFLWHLEHCRASSHLEVQVHNVLLAHHYYGSPPPLTSHPIVITFGIGEKLSKMVYNSVSYPLKSTYRMTLYTDCGE